MYKFIKFCFLAIFFTFAGWYARSYFYSRTSEKPINETLLASKDTSLEKYAIENLTKSPPGTGIIKIKEGISENENYNSYMFEFEFSPDMSDIKKKTTGQINIPLPDENSTPVDSYPIVLMFRGYIDQSTYKTGDGTRNAANYFAENGFITIAPDFLGYGGSDKESGNIFETRFQTYVTALSLLKTIEQATKSPLLISGFPKETDIKRITNSKINIWAHSNGGQIALTLLEINPVKYPTVLWAPVSKPFPYSVLYYTDVSDDNGKLIRKELARFEESYDAEKYSLTNYLANIEAPTLIQQGEADDAVPVTWSQDLHGKLKSLNKETRLISYPGTDHNMRPSWDQAVATDLEFYSAPVLDTVDN